MQEKYLLNNAVVLTKNNSHARQDKHNLRRIFDVHSIFLFDSANQGLEHLKKNNVDLILCDSDLQDMEGLQFLQQIRCQTEICSLPVIMVTPENRRNKVLDAIAAGCNGYVLRPYSEKTFERHINAARQVEQIYEIENEQLAEAKDLVSRGEFDEGLELYSDLVAMEDEAQKYYDLGCQHLVDQKYGKAIIAFKRAIKINELFAEAYSGMANAYKGKGDIESYKQYLKKAADIHAQFDRLEKTKELFIEILKHDKDSVNPYNTLGVSLRKKGDYDGAVHAYKQGLKITDDENIKYNLSKALYYKGDREQALAVLNEALEKRPDFVEARTFKEQLEGREASGNQEHKRQQFGYAGASRFRLDDS